MSKIFLVVPDEYNFLKRCYSYKEDGMIFIVSVRTYDTKTGMANVLLRHLHPSNSKEKGWGDYLGTVRDVDFKKLGELNQKNTPNPKNS